MMNRKYKSLITKSFSFLLFFDSIQALDVALVVAVLVLEVGVVSRDDSDHVDGGPGGDDGVEVPLGSPALGLESLGRGVLTLAGVVLPANPGIFQGLTGPPVEQPHADGAVLLAGRVRTAGVETLQWHPLQTLELILAVFLQLGTVSEGASGG